MEDIKIIPGNGIVDGTTNDWTLDADGNPETLSGVSRVRQDLIKILLTRRGSNYLFSNYGTLLSDLVGSRTTPSTNQSIGNEVIYGVSYLNALASPVADSLPDSEKISSIQKLDIRQDESDPTSFVVRLQIQTVSGEYISLMTKG